MSVDPVTIVLVVLLILALLALVVRGIARSRSGRVNFSTANRAPAFGKAGLEVEVQQVARTKRKIAAIKLYRQRTGVGLREAKDAVESMTGGGAAMPTRGLVTTGAVSIDDLILKGKKIEAIKQYRYQTGSGLMEAKAAIDARAAELGV